MVTAKPRLKVPNREQAAFQFESIDALLPPEDAVRDVWAFVASLDLSEFWAAIGSRPGRAGAPAIDPRLLLALWLQATIDGIGSSRVLADLCDRHLAYRWLCGGVSVGYHVLADFRTAHGPALDRVLADTVAVLLERGVVTLTRVAQDGLRVRAAAGASSFRREPTLEACRAEAEAQVAALKAHADEDDGAASRRSQAAQERAARERLERLDAARANLEQLRAVNATQPTGRAKDPQQVRVSTTDPACRRMKMADGGVRPAYNVQYATTTVGGAIVGVAVTNEGTDGGQLPPMLDRIERTFGVRPDEVLVDGGFVTVAAIDEAERRGSAVYAPVKSADKQRAKGQDPFARKPSDTDATARWRGRMGTVAAQLVYRERAQTAEWVNAGVRNRGLDRVTVRGPTKVRTVAVWHAVVHNLGRILATTPPERPAD